MERETDGSHAVSVAESAVAVRDRSFLKMTDEDWELVLRIHAGGTFWCAQEAALRMKDQGTGGAIVNTVSAAHMGNFGQTNYGGAKGAIASMTYTWANELSRYGIRVNAISPSATTRMSASAKGADGKVIDTPFLDPNLNGPLVVLVSVSSVGLLFGGFYVLLATPFAAVLATLLDVIVLDKDPAEQEVPAVIFPAKDAETG